MQILYLSYIKKPLISEKLFYIEVHNYYLKKTPVLNEPKLFIVENSDALIISVSPAII